MTDPMQQTAAFAAWLKANSDEWGLDVGALSAAAAEAFARRVWEAAAVSTVDATAAIIQARIDTGTPFDSPAEHLEAVKAEILALKKPAEPRELLTLATGLLAPHPGTANTCATGPLVRDAYAEQKAGMAGPVVRTGGAAR